MGATVDEGGNVTIKSGADKRTVTITATGKVGGVAEGLSAAKQFNIV